jgi:hypothetical protein
MREVRGGVRADHELLETLMLVIQSSPWPCISHLEIHLPAVSADASGLPPTVAHELRAEAGRGLGVSGVGGGFGVGGDSSMRVGSSSGCDGDERAGGGGGGCACRS